MDPKVEAGQSAVFKSPMREQRLREEAVPPIGQYDTSSETIERRLKKQMERGSPGPRRMKNGEIVESNYAIINRHNSKKKLRERTIPRNEENLDDYLGPGYYYIPREFDETILGFKGNIIIPKDKRFREKTSDVPGPGAYIDNSEQWNKKTYNLIFNNDAS
eukprot:TRINITY_DN8382_c0_g4_i1.p1 TRINITY_DN8382_c0_g4~~TRINITY_DN8382_c0_g4_i1.p1  ORF type:complete len:161 (+),score=29.33 TRINITY_DN8382_c0_g4_i1:459-941(+)